MDWIARRIIFAEAVRVFQKMLMCVLVISVIFSVHVFIVLILGDDKLSKLAFFAYISSSEVINSISWFLMSWVVTVSWAVFTFLAYRIHFDLQMLGRTESISRFLNFLVSIVVFNTLCSRVVNWILSPLPELLLADDFRQIGSPWFVEITMSAEWLLATVVLCFFGSWFPALLTKRDVSVLATMQRGYRQFFWTFGQFLLGPGLFVLLALIAVVAIKSLTGTVIDTTYEHVAPLVVFGAGLFAFAAMVSVILAMMFCIILGAIILSQSLLRDEKATGTRAANESAPTDKTKFSFYWKGA